MKRYVVISTTNSKDYFFYLPYAEKAWAALGWDLVVMITQETYEANRAHIEKYQTPMLDFRRKETMQILLPKIDGLREATIAQAGRLYAANYFEKEVMLMTCDMDLIPLSDYWHPAENEITCYGHDLTDYSYLPMGYCAMSSKNWKHYLQCTGYTEHDMLRDANETKVAWSEKWEDWWNFDWGLLTKRLMPHKDKIRFVKRGRRPGEPYAYGRIDRGDSMKIIDKPWIDIHCENAHLYDDKGVLKEVKVDKFLKVFEEVYGKL